MPPHLSLSPHLFFSEPRSQTVADGHGAGVAPHPKRSSVQHYRLWSAIGCVGVLLSICTSAVAQSPSNLPPATQDIPPRPETLPVDPPEPLPPLDSVPNWEPPSSDSSAPNLSDTERIFVSRFEIIGSTVFESEEFEQIAADYVNRDLSFNELLQVRADITQLYVDAGYITSVAILPPQTPTADTIHIQVIEGSLETIEIRGTNRLQTRYIRDRLARADRIPLNTDRIVAALQLLQLDPRIQRTSAELSAGTRLGQSVLTVDVVEANTVGVDVLLNSNRSPNVGSFERGLLLEELNLFGRGDRFTLGWRNTDGSDVINSSYSHPLNAKEGTLSLDVAQSWGEVIEEPFERLGIVSEAADFTLAFRQPLILEPRAEVSLGISGFLRRARTEFENFAFPFPLKGADDEGRTRLSVLRFDQDGLWRGSRQVIAGRSQVSFGLDALGATSNASDPDGQYIIWRGQVQWARSLAPSTLLVIRGSAQVADRELPPVEQFQLGGLNSIRGYRESLLLADNGVTVSAEVRIPLFNDPDGAGRIQLVPFIDAGAGWNNGELEVGQPNNALASTGLGLLWQQGDRLDARFTWGLPLIDGNSTSDTLQDSGISMGVRYTFF